MTRTRIVTSALVIGLLGLGLAQGQSGQDLFQQALVKERAEGNLSEAVALYQKVMATTSDRALAAQAQLRIGLCLEKLGAENLAGAREAFQAVVDRYADQAEPVRVARERLSETSPARASSGPAGPRLRKVSDQLGGGFYGTVSPDGRYFSYVDWPDGNMVVHDRSTGKARRLTASPGWYKGHAGFGDMSIVSPDSRQIAYAWYPANGPGELRIVAVDGTKDRLLAGPGPDGKRTYPWPCDWSSDGKTILAMVETRDAVNGDHEDIVALVSSADGSVTTIKSLGNRHSASMRLSPDGRFIAYDIQQEVGAEAYDIHLLSVDGKIDMPLVRQASHDFNPLWTPDGGAVVFLSDRAGGLAVWRVRLDDGRPQGEPERLMPLVATDATAIGLSLDGTLFLNVNDRATDVYTVGLDERTGRVTGEPAMAGQRFEGTNSLPAWSPDGRTLAFLSRPGPDRTILVLRDAASGRERDVPLDITWRSRPVALQWSPDGRRVAMFDNHPGEKNLWVAEVADGSVSSLFQLGPDERYFDVHFSPDGRTLYYLASATDATATRLVARTLASGEERVIIGPAPPEFVTHFALSPDGSSIVFRPTTDAEANTRAVFRIVPAAGGEARTILDERAPEGRRLPRAGGLEWTPDARYVLFGRLVSDGRTQKVQVCRVAAAGGAIEPLSEPLPEHYRHFSLHPDGRRLAYYAGRQGKGAGIWVLENFLLPSR